MSAAVAAANSMAHRHPGVGRQLASLLTGAGFDEVRSETDAVVWTSLQDLSEIIPIASVIHRAVTAGTISAADGAAWADEQKQLSATGRFRARLDRVVASVPIAARQ